MSKTTLEKLADRLGRQRTPEGKARSWWRWPLIILLILIGLAVAAWVINRDRRELARLRHEKYKREQEARNAAVDAQVAATEAATDAALERVSETTHAIDAADAQLAKARRKYERDEAAIDRLRWSDL